MQYLEKVCCFFVFARIFLHMCPNEKYEKYLGVLTSWIALCIFLSPFLTGDMFWESYDAWEKRWEAQVENNMDMSVEGLEEESRKAATQIVEEMEEDYELGTDQ